MRLYHIVLALALLCACSRIQEERASVEGGEELTLDVSIADLVEKSFYAQEGGSLKCYWDAGDSISIISLHNGTVSSIDLFTTESGGTTASFSGRFNGSKTDLVIALYPALVGNQSTGYHSPSLPGNQDGLFRLKIGDSSLSFCPSVDCFILQTSNGNYSHIPFGDVMTGTVDINTAGGSVSLTKNSALLKVTASIPALPASEKIMKMTLKASGGTPFTSRAATLPLASAAGVWTTAVPCDSVSINFGSNLGGVATGITANSTTLTAYIPVLPNTSTAAFQGDTERKLTVTVTTDLSIYSAEKTIPAKTGSVYSFPLTSGTLNTINASLTKTGDADPELTKWFRTITSVADVDVEAEKLKTEILNTASECNITGTTYYVSNAGSDSNSGTSQAAPIKTLSKVNSLSLKPGDGVLFRRGDLWRGTISVKDGITYSAYGTGSKPKIYNSPFDAAKQGSWTLTSVANVYRYSSTLPHSQDVGTLIFNDGDDLCAYKVVTRKDYQGNTYHADTMQPFSGWEDLSRDRDMYHDPNTGYIYLCSTAGNPAQRWNSIEVPIKGNTFNAYGNNYISFVVDNICIKYTGSHGIGTGHMKDLTVTNCEIGWIGGSLQNDNGDNAPSSPGQYSRPVRYGNGVEIWGWCNSFKVAHNYIYQVYDAAISPQYSTDANVTGKWMDNMSFVDNLIEKSVYAIEYWLSVGNEYLEVSGMRNYLIKGNIMRMSGEWGWGWQRFNKDSPAIIKTGTSSNPKNRAVNFRMEGNIIDRGKPTLVNIRAGKAEWLPVCRANVYLHDRSASIGDMAEQSPKVIYVN